MNYSLKIDFFLNKNIISLILKFHFEFLFKFCNFIGSSRSLISNFFNFKLSNFRFAFMYGYAVNFTNILINLIIFLDILIYFYIRKS